MIDASDKKSPERSATARQIIDMRQKERSDGDDGVETLRDAEQLIIALGGVEHMFNQVRTLPSNVILDIGGGTTIGINEIAESSLGHGLDFHATVLTHKDEIQRHLGRARTHHTPVETLRKIPSNSVGGIIGTYSIGYSPAPELAVLSIDRVLVPGGVLKATFNLPDIPPSPHGLNTAAAFIRELEKKGYATAPINRAQSAVLLAVKPGSSSVSAKTLLEQDIATAVEQAERVKRDNRLLQR